MSLHAQLYLYIVVFTVVAYFLYVKFNGNITGFFRIGENFPKSPYLNISKALIFPGEFGADGQQFLSIAFDPLLKNPDSIEALDVPVYRYRRILYPLLGNLLGFGQTNLIPYVMVLLNSLSIVAIVVFAGLYLQSVGDKAWKSLAVLCIPSVWLILIFSTAGLLNSSLLVGTLYFHRVGKFSHALPLIALACLTRETSVIIWSSLFVFGFLQRRWPQSLSLLGALSPLIIWNSYLRSRTELQTESDVISSNFGYPLEGILTKIFPFIQMTGEGSTLYKFYELYSFSLLILTFSLLLWIVLRNIRFQPELTLAAASYALIFLSSNNTAHFLGYNRIFINVYLLLLLVQSSIIPDPASQAKLLMFGGAGIGSIAFLVAIN